MTATRDPHPNSPLTDCLRKTQFPSKKKAKQAAGRRSGPTVVYPCLWPNHDGFETDDGKHWHYARRRRPEAVAAAFARAALEQLHVPPVDRDRAPRPAFELRPQPPAVD